MKVAIESRELYPAYTVVDAEAHPTLATFDVDGATVTRWQDAERRYMLTLREIRDVVDPPCPECDHPRSRHQEWSESWDRWACLTCKTCEYGRPT